MERVQTGCHLHGLYLVNGLACGVERTSQVEWGTSVGIVVFNHQILHLLSIHERSCEGVLLSLDIVVIFKTVLSQHVLDLLVGTWRDLVNHRPREGNLLLVLQIVEESLRNQSVLHPALSIGKDTSLHLVAIVRTVVHRLYGEGQFASLEALEEQCTHLTHGKQGLHATGEVSLVIGIALLGNGE